MLWFGDVSLALGLVPSCVLEESCVVFIMMTSLQIIPYLAVPDLSTKIMI